jgi:hypothetical protein
MADSTCLTTKTNTWLHRGASAIVASSLVFAAYRIHDQLSDEHVWERRPDGHTFTPGTLFITEHVRTGAKVGEVLRTHHQLACSIANAYRPALVSTRYNSDAGAHQQREWCRPRSITSLFVGNLRPSVPVTLSVTIGAFAFVGALPQQPFKAHTVTVLVAVLERIGLWSLQLGRFVANSAAEVRCRRA